MPPGAVADMRRVKYDAFCFIHAKSLCMSPGVIDFEYCHSMPPEISCLTGNNKIGDFCNKLGVKIE